METITILPKDHAEKKRVRRRVCAAFDHHDGTTTAGEDRAGILLIDHQVLAEEDQPEAKRSKVTDSDSAALEANDDDSTVPHSSSAFSMYQHHSVSFTGARTRQNVSPTLQQTTKEEILPVQSSNSRRRVLSPQSTMILSSLDSSESLMKLAPELRDFDQNPSLPATVPTSGSNFQTTAVNESSPCLVEAIKTPENKFVKAPGGSWMAILSLLLLTYKTIFSNSNAPVVDPASVYVPGAGFSGFWYTLGRLRSIPDPSQHNYYCYSAGCLGVVATWNGLDMPDVYHAAVSMQTQWKNGQISRYDVVGGFVDYLLQSNSTHHIDFSKLNVITTAKNGWFGVRLSIQNPTSVESLRTLLVQTTWIPFAVGDGLWHHGHMDGGVTALLHPQCEVHLDLPLLDFDLLANIVNVNLGRDKVEKFWIKGLVQGLN